MSFKLIDCLLLLVVTACPSLANYGTRDVSNYRLNSDLGRYPVRSPDELFGFGDQVSTDFNPDNPNDNNNSNDNRNNNNNNNNNMNMNINDNNDNMNSNNEESNVIQNTFQNQVDDYINNMMAAPIQTQRKKLRKNRVKSGYRKPMASKPKKIIFSQYMSPQYLESEESYSLKPTDTFEDPYLSQLMPHIMATAEHMALEKEAEETIRSYAKVIPASKIMRILRSSDFFHLTDSPYGLKKRSD